MQFKVSMATAILTGGLMTLPAMAGVTGAGGGEKSVTNGSTTTVRNVENVRRVDNVHRVDTVQNQYSTTHRTVREDNKYVINGTVRAKWWYGGPGLKYGDAGGWRYFNADREVRLQDGNVNAAIDNMVRTLKNQYKYLDAYVFSVTVCGRSGRVIAQGGTDTVWASPPDWSAARTASMKSRPLCRHVA